MLGSALAVGAGDGTSGFFRKVPAVGGEEQAAEEEAARVEGAKGKKGKKRKAEDELVPGPEEERRRPVRNR